jgi:hypothetical protein
LPAFPTPQQQRFLISDETMEFAEERENVHQSQSQIPAQVGIHFGFDFLSAVALVDGSPRTVYEPSPNTISFDSQNDTVIGETGSFSAKAILTFRELFKNLDLNRKPNIPNWKSCPIEGLVASVLAHLHRVVERALHTTNVAYVIALPSWVNKPARTAMNYAVQIAGLISTIVRDTCGLTAYFMQDFYSPVFTNNSLQKIVLQSWRMIRTSLAMSSAMRSATSSCHLSSSVEIILRHGPSSALSLSEVLQSF